MQQAVCVRRKKRKTRGKKSAPLKTQHEIPSSRVTASNSRRHARKHVTRVSPYSPASIDLGFVEIGLVQLWQSVKTTSVTHTLSDTDRRTDRQTIFIMAPCAHPDIKRLFCLKAKTSSVASLSRTSLITSREENEAKRPHTCRRPCAFEEINEKEKNTKYRAIVQ